MGQRERRRSGFKDRRYDDVAVRRVEGALLVVAAHHAAVTAELPLGVAKGRLAARVNSDAEVIGETMSARGRCDPLEHAAADGFTGGGNTMQIRTGNSKAKT